MFCINDGIFLCITCQKAKHEGKGHNILYPEKINYLATCYSLIPLLETKRDNYLALREETWNILSLLNKEIVSLHSQIYDLKSELIQWMNTFAEDSINKEEGFQRFLDGVPFPIVHSKIAEKINSMLEDFDKFSNSLEDFHARQISISKELEGYLNSLYVSYDEGSGILHYCEKGTNVLQIIDPDQGFTALSKLIIQKGKFQNLSQTCSIGPKVQCVGGFDEGCYKNEIQEIDLINKLFVKRKSMQKVRGHFSLCSNKEEIFIIGGQNLENLIKDCESQRLDKDCWNELPNFPHTIELAGSAIEKDFLFVIGGYSNKCGLSNSIFKLDLKERENWELIKQDGLFSPRQRISAVFIDKLKGFLIVGGTTTKGESKKAFKLRNIKNDEQKIDEFVELTEAISFSGSSPPLSLNGNICSFASNGSLLLYSIKENEWKIRQKNRWQSKDNRKESMQSSNSSSEEKEEKSVESDIEAKLKK